MKETVRGKVVKGLGGLYEVLTDTTPPTRLSCRARGIFRHEDIRVLVGDEVTVQRDGGEEVIDTVLARRNSLIRPPMANLDLLLVVLAAAKPQPALETVDKLLAIAEHNAIAAAVVITKRDLDEEACASYADVYRKAGYPVFLLRPDDPAAVLGLRAYVTEQVRGGHTAAVAGASGVGKSTLLNAIFPHLSLPTAAVSRRIERGRHTTRHVELFPLGEGAESGFLADTPGFSLLDFMQFDFFALEDLPTAFAEFAPYLGRCRYSDCTHTGESASDCAVAAAVAAGAIAQSRKSSYEALYRILKAKKNIFS